jgi:hypothetical protein
VKQLDLLTGILEAGRRPAIGSAAQESRSAPRGVRCPAEPMLEAAPHQGMRVEHQGRRLRRIGTTEVYTLEQAQINKRLHLA